MIQPLLLKNYNPNLFLSPCINQVAQISMIDRPDIYLVSSIILETLSTCCLKNTLTNKIWFLPVYTIHIYICIYWLCYCILYFSKMFK